MMSTADNKRNAYELYLQACYLKKFKEYCKEKMELSDIVYRTGEIIYRMKDELMADGTSKLKDYLESFTVNSDNSDSQMPTALMYQSSLDAFVLLNGLNCIFERKMPVYFTNPEVFNLLFSGRSIRSIESFKAYCQKEVIENAEKQ